MKLVRHLLRRRPQVFLRPTRHGLWWLGTLLVLLMIGWGYGNNLCLALAMLLFAITVVFLMEAHFNLDGLSLEGLEVKDQFSGQTTQYLLRWRSRKNKKRRGLQWVWDGPMQAEGLVHSELKGTGGSLEGHTCFMSRGHHVNSYVILRSHYPLGLFLAWSYHRLPLEVWAYPTPLAGALMGAGEKIEGETLESHISRDGDQPSEFRLYREGDALSRIAWKVVARGLPAHTKTFESAQTEKKRFYWPWGGGGERERSVLAQAIQKAYEEKASWTLETPGHQLDWGTDAIHRQRSLRLLTEAP